MDTTAIVFVILPFHFKNTRLYFLEYNCCLIARLYLKSVIKMPRWKICKFKKLNYLQNKSSWSFDWHEPWVLFLSAFIPKIFSVFEEIPAKKNLFSNLCFQKMRNSGSKFNVAPLHFIIRACECANLNSKSKWGDTFSEGAFKSFTKYLLINYAMRKRLSPFRQFLGVAYLAEK